MEGNVNQAATQPPQENVPPGIPTSNPPQESDMATKSLRLQKLEIAGLVTIILVLGGSILFFDQIKSLVTKQNKPIQKTATIVPDQHTTASSDPTPTTEPDTGLVCAGYKRLDEALAHIDTACALDLSNQNLSELPKDVLKLKNLTSINLDNNKFTAFPDDLTTFTKLQRIDMKNNQLTNIPNSITKLSSLQIIDFSNNKLATLPNISSMLYLQTIDVSQNNFSAQEKESINKMFDQRNSPQKTDIRL
ncbi:MAG TPA: hypothetical protein VG965_03225 [Patescibacteria group bacterium]|nr:hypothetical protein [Patescibacteria group bacterium]